MENESIINKRVHDFTKQIDIVQTVLVFLVALLVPTFLAQLIQSIFGTTSFMASKAQYVVGSIVNTALIMTAINLKGWAKIIGVVTMPSISTVLGGLIFPAVSTPYMVCLIPAIWLGNYTLVMAYKGLMLKKNLNYFVAGIIGIVVKVAIIFGWFSLLKYFGVFPDNIATALSAGMSYIQAITATIGMVISFIIYKTEFAVINKKN